VLRSTYKANEQKANLARTEKTWHLARALSDAMAPRSLLAVLLLSLICASTAYVAIDSQYVLGVAIEDSARAYPLEVLNYHEIVNDEYKNVSFAVTWAPLTGSNVVLLTQPLYSFVLGALFVFLHFSPFSRFLLANMHSVNTNNILLHHL
jgi:hypothetical protein